MRLTIGIAVFPQDGVDAVTLVANADAALFRAKSEARGSIRFFEMSMDKQLRDKRALQQDLRTAIVRDEIELHYQPQAHIGGKITGFEALVRWHHPRQGLVSPTTFIPLAEESGIIVELGEWILRTACREAASWPRPLSIAINLSPVQFQHGDLPKLVHQILLETGLAPSRLELEITEGVLIGDFNRAVSILRRLKALGVRIAMDDFGTGYSSLSYLQSFPFDKIKIDQSFIANLGHSQQAATIVRAVIALGRGLDLPVVAEGVETEEQLKFLAGESCNEIQGYLVGRPKPIADYAALVGRIMRPWRKRSPAEPSQARPIRSKSLRIGFYEIGDRADSLRLDPEIAVLGLRLQGFDWGGSPPSSKAISTLSALVKCRLSLASPAGGDASQPSLRWDIMSVGTVMRDKAMLATPSGWLLAIIQCGCERVIVEVSTKPSTSPAAMAPSAAENGPCWYRLARLGRPPASSDRRQPLDVACMSGAHAEDRIHAVVVIVGRVDDGHRKTVGSEHIAGAHQEIPRAPFH